MNSKNVLKKVCCNVAAIFVSINISLQTFEFERYKKNVLIKVCRIVDTIFVFITILLQILEFEPLRHSVSCIFLSLIFCIINLIDEDKDFNGVILWGIAAIASLSAIA